MVTIWSLYKHNNFLRFVLWHWIDTLKTFIYICIYIYITMQNLSAMPENQLIVYLSHFQDIVTELATLTVSSERAKVVDFLFPVFETYLTAMIPTERISRSFILKPLQLTVWLVCVSVAFVVGIFVYGFEIPISPGKSTLSRKKRKLSSYMLMSFSAIAYQGNRPRGFHYINFFRSWFLNTKPVS